MSDKADGALQRRDHRPELSFIGVPFPQDAPPLEVPGPGADGNTRTFFSWSRAQLFAERLEQTFPSRPNGALWGCEVLERDCLIGEWPDGDYESYAYVSVGILFDPRNVEARDFAYAVRENSPKSWAE